ncbi:hypothetical protein BN1723_008787 [Verticillium longisporum]|uniref:Uncharacterized protein n=1 Tax=Verticillium longisporum TaxID=100787 RepID=A0A0G4KJM4_VERLO|nr:hypothetical protein BN1723_008787 [Verticillium longisporum]
MSGSQAGSQLNIDRYVVIHVATTCDEHGVYVTKDSAEVIELGWILLDAKSLEEIVRDSALVKPINTPITPLCSEVREEWLDDDMTPVVGMLQVLIA